MTSMNLTLEKRQAVMLSILGWYVWQQGDDDDGPPSIMSWTHPRSPADAPAPLHGPTPSLAPPAVASGLQQPTSQHAPHSLPSFPGPLHRVNSRQGLPLGTHPLRHLNPPLLPRPPRTCPTAARACFLASWLGLADRPKRWQPTPTAPLVTMTTWWPEEGQGKMGGREREAKESWEGGGELGGAESHAITAKVPSQAMHGNRTRRLWL